MLKDITIGQYIYGTSVLHRMEPSVKIVLTLCYAVIVLALKSLLSYAVYAVFTAAVIMVSAVPFKMLFKGLKPLLWIYAFTALFNLFMTPGHEIVRLLSLTVTSEGICAALLLAVRLTLLVMGTSLLTLTTAPLELTGGIEKLLSPLERIKLPAHEIAMMMTIAIRFIPTIGDEAQRLVKAQKSRGADMESGSFIRRARAMVPVIVPLLTGVFRRADELADAMDSRCYGSGRRTRMKETHISGRDIAAAAVFAAVSATVIAFN